MIFPPKLQAGDEVRVVSPSKSLKIVDEGICALAAKCLHKMGLNVSFGKNAYSMNRFGSSSVQERIDDIHDAYSDRKVKAVFAAFGGENSNELLAHLDYKLIANNVKFLVGYSDICTLQNAILSKTGVVTYYGPVFTTLGMKLGADYTINCLKQILFGSSPISYSPSDVWSDDAWYLNQDKRTFKKNDGPVVINHGKGNGRIVGGEMTTVQLLFGTEYMPSLQDSILALEITNNSVGSTLPTFKRILQSFIHQRDFSGVKGMIIGRTESRLQMPLESIVDVVGTHPELKGIPVIANVDFGHTDPFLTLPIGGTMAIDTEKKKELFVITEY